MTTTDAKTPGYDVAILGSGIGGAELATILARHKVRVIVIEEAAHPRFAIGEATVPESTTWHRLMAARFDVPELGYLGRLRKMHDHVSSACGVKRNFTFLYHREGAPQEVQETTQLNVLPPPFGPDIHMYRQDIDAYLTHLAVRYGAVVRQRTNVKQIDLEADGVRLETSTGEVIRASYLVDAGGFRSPVAQKLALRDDPPATRTNTRTMFTHMIGVKPYDECGHPRQLHGFPSPFFQGTLHHVTPFGWIWVIHFDNHPDSTNPLCSVGLTLNRLHSPKAERPPDEEFWTFVRRFPSIAAHFEHARPVRDWVVTDRLQYTSHQVLGERFCLMPHAAGFIDPIFSGGMSITAAACAALSDRLIAAVRANDFSPERFRYVEELVQHNFAFYDRLVAGTFTAFCDFELWNAWQRIWILGSLLGPNGLINLELMHHETGDARYLRAVEAYPYSGMLGSGLREMQQLFDQVAGEVEAVRDQGADPKEAARRIYEHFRQAAFLPPMLGITDRSRHYPMTFTPIPLLRYALWAKTRAPAWFEQYYFHFRITTVVKLILRSLLDDVSGPTMRTYARARDYLVSWNSDWRRASARRPALTAMTGPRSERGRT